MSRGMRKRRRRRPDAARARILLALGQLFVYLLRLDPA